MVQDTGTEIIKQLESAGFRAALLSYHAIEQIKKSYNELSEKNKSIQYVQNAVTHFNNNQPPNIPFEPLSFLILAYPSDSAQIIFNMGGKRVAVPIPPTYYNVGVVWNGLPDLIENVAKGYHTAHCRGISQKLLAVHSGLGRYGRNNICYIDGLGSYFRLRAFYTDIPCENSCYPLRFLDRCKTCELCRQNCPTGAIGQNSAIDASLCLTGFNESNDPMPDWLPENIHHTMVGCLRCQEICPYNKSLSEKILYTLELNEIETNTYLSFDSSALLPELKTKFEQSGFGDFFSSSSSRNAKFVIKNLTI